MNNVKQKLQKWYRAASLSNKQTSSSTVQTFTQGLLTVTLCSTAFSQDGTKRLNYAIVGPSELATVNKLLYATYHPYEPLTSHLGLCNGLNSMKDMDRMVESYLEKNLTL